jgi:iron(II)-dependent oxidoreductase
MRDGLRHTDRMAVRDAFDSHRRIAGSALADALRDSRATTLARVTDLGGEAWRVPQQRGINPVAWELGHLAWFAEFWILRGPHTLGDEGFIDATRPPRIVGPDGTFDSARLDHARRWNVALPLRDELIAILGEQLEACIAAIPATRHDADLYFHRLALFHEDMHGEALAWMRAELQQPAPAGLATLVATTGEERMSVDGGSVEIGRIDGDAGFSFDNELPTATVHLAPFEIDASPITAGRFARFVDAGGYDAAEFWPGAAGAWRAASSTSHPARWRRSADGWETRWFDRWLPIDSDAPVIHVNAWEAEAYCRWAKRRLPAAAEWEAAAREPRFRWGHSVWEWTADAFEPYRGFRPGPYRDYSLPWFSSHRELRGGSFATHARLHHPSYRNFFTPERYDIFAGFRTASIGEMIPSQPATQRPAL